MGKSTDAFIKELTAEVVADYSRRHNISKIDCESRPNKEQIIDILDNILNIIYPGYYGKKILSGQLVEYYVGELLENIRHNLKKQLIHVYLHEQKNKDIFDEDLRIKADEITVEFLSKIPKLREMLSCDVVAAYDGDPAAYSTDEIIYSYPGLYAISINRVAHELYLLKVPIIPRIMTEHAHSITGIDIHPGATIGKNFFIDHGTGVVIGETTVIGDNVKIYQGVTLGGLSTRGGQSLKGAKRHPTLEDDVTVYSGASILGGDTVIGKGTTIGGNAFVTKSVNAYTRVSIRSPELLFKDSSNQTKNEYLQDEFWFWTI